MNDMAKVYKRDGVWFGTADDMVAMIKRLEAEKSRLRQAVHSAFREGHRCGWNDRDTWANGSEALEDAWPKSNAFDAIAAE